jgi:hypothetical protein
VNKLAGIETLEAKGMEFHFRDIQEKKALLHGAFRSNVEPEKGVFGETVRVKDNGVIEKLSKTPDGHYHKEYWANGKIFQVKESLGDKKVATIDYDDNGTPYSRIVRQSVDHKAKIVEEALLPNAKIVKGNFIAITDDLGRPVLNKVTDLHMNAEKRVDVTKYRDSSYRVNDQGGHLIAHQFGGSSGKENIVPQLDKVNLSKMKQVEHTVKTLKEQGYTVDYEVKSNYVGSNTRPSSFEPKITVDGQEYTDLPDDLKKIYNDGDISTVKKAMTDIGEVYGSAHETGIKSGLVAAGVTFAVSTVDNVSAYIDGEITDEEMVVDIVTETAAAGVIEYGSEIISATVSHAMSKSSSALIQKVAGTSLPGAVVSFAVESYDSVSAYAKGEIDTEELAYELGENAASVAGAMKGASIGAAVGAVAGPVGAVAGGLVGGVVGAAIASEVYATAVEIGAEGVEFIAEQAENLIQGTVELVEEHIPEVLEDVKEAFTDFIKEFKLPFRL